jgi:hypothetical protein
VAEGLPDLRSRIRLDTSDLDGVGDKLSGLGKKLALGLGGVLTGVAAFGAESARKFQEVGTEVIKLSRLTGEAADSSSRLRFAAHETGVDVDQLGTSLGILSKHLAANDKAAKGAGVAYRDAKGNVKPLNSVLLDLADQFQKMPDGAEKNAKALALFGRSGLAMIPFLNKGKAGLADLEKEADKFGLVLGKDNLDAIKKNIAAQREFHAALDGLRVQVGQYVLPALAAATEGLTKFLVAGLNSDAFKTLKQDVSDFFSGLLHGTDALGSAQGTFAAFGASIRAVVSGLVDLLHGDVKGFAGELAAAFGFDSGSAVFAGLTRFGDAVTGLVQGIVKLIRGDLAGAAVDIGTGFGFTEDSAVVTGLIHFFDLIKAGVEWIGSHLDIVRTFGEVVGGLIVAEKVAGGINSVAGGVRDLATVLNPANTQLGQLVTGLGKVAGKTFSVTLDVAQAGAGAVGDLGAKIGKSVGDAVSKAMSQSLKDQAQSAGLSAALQSLADKVAGGLAGGLSVAFGPSLLDGFVGALPAIGEAIAGALVAVASSPVLLAAAIVVAVAAAGALIFAFRKPLAEFFTQTLPSFFTDTALPAIATFFTDTLPRAIGDAIGTAVAGWLVLFVVLPIRLVQMLVEAVPAVVGAAVGLATAIGTAIGQALLSLGELAGQAIDAVVRFFVALPDQVGRALAALPGIVASAVEAVVGFVLRLPAELPGYVEAAVNGMVKFFSQLPGAAVNFFGQVINTVVSTLENIVRAIFNWSVVRVIGDILGKVLEGFRDGWRRVNELTGGALNELTKAVGDALKAVVGLVAGIGKRIVEAVGDLSRLLYNAGRDVIQGFIDGIRSRAGDIARALTDPIGAGVSAVRGLLNSHSPSRVFMGIGEDTGLGFVLGVEGMQDRVARALAGLVAVPDTLASVNLGALNDVARSAAPGAASSSSGPLRLTAEQPIILNIDGKEWVRANATMIAEETTPNMSGSLEDRRVALS